MYKSINIWCSAPARRRRQEDRWGSNALQPKGYRARWCRRQPPQPPEGLGQEQHPAHLLNNQQVTRTQHTRKKQRRHRTAKQQNTHTHKTHTLNDERQRLSSCCQSRRRRPQDRAHLWKENLGLRGLPAFLLQAEGVLLRAFDDRSLAVCNVPEGALRTHAA